MEAFSLLKYWRGGGGVAVSGGLAGGQPRATTIIAAVPRSNPDTDDDDDDDDDDNGDNGPFFDLEFSLTDEEVEEKKDEAECDNDAFTDEENDEQNDDAVESSDADQVDKREFNFTVTSGSNSSNNNDDDQTDPSVVVSPCDENLFFKGRLVPVESNSVDSSKAQFAVTSSLLKSATKIRVFLLGFKKSKANAPVTDETSNDKPNENVNMEEEPTKTTINVNKQSKFFTVKFNVEEVPLVSMFTRENSKSVKTAASSQKHCDKSEEPCVVLSDEKQRFSKDVMQKYLKKVKPLYVRVSKRYGDKLRFSGQLSFKTTEEKGSMAVAEVAEATVVGAGVKSVKDGLPAGLRVVYKHLGKSRSASSAAVAAAPSPSETVASRRRDDSLLQQQDGIQGAILHCKRSFNASRDSDSSPFPKSVRDPSHEKSNDLSSMKSSDSEPKKAGKV